jgi:hypothetical protein
LVLLLRPEEIAFFDVDFFIVQAWQIKHSEWKLASSDLMGFTTSCLHAQYNNN